MQSGFRRGLICATLMVGFCAIGSHAFAQEPRLGGRIGGGVGFPLANTADNVKVGGQVEGGVTYRLNDLVSIAADTALHIAGLKDDVLRRLDVGGGDVTLWYGSGDIIIHPHRERMHPYAIAGGGAYYRRVELTQPGVGTVDVCDPFLLICYPTLTEVDQVVGTRSTTDFGLNVGGGLAFRIDRRVGVFVEGRYHHVFSDRGRANFLPVTVGLKF